jgi:hypothetical protein
VDDDAGGVDDAAEPRPSGLDELAPQALAQVAGVVARADLVARLGEHGAGRLDCERVCDLSRQLVD